MDQDSIQRHLDEMQANSRSWNEKPLLRQIYNDFYGIIRSCIDRDIPGLIVELGSGIGNLKMAIPEAISSDIFPNQWNDRVENAYRLSFDDQSVSHLVLFDVFHHLGFPGTALKEFSRVLVPGGKVIIFEPALSVLGWLTFGIFHPEPIGYNKKITWESAPGAPASASGYYAAQGNACRVFLRRKYNKRLDGWEIKGLKKYAAISYVASGGYSRKQLYPDSLYHFMKKIDHLLDHVPLLFATRILIVLQKK